MNQEQPSSPEDKEFTKKHTRILAAFKSGQYDKVEREDIADDPGLLGDKEIMTLAVSILGGDLLENASESIRDDAEIVFRACTYSPGIGGEYTTWDLQFASNRLKSDVAFIRRIVENTPRRMDFVDGVRRNVPKDVWEQVRNSFKQL